MWKCFKSGLTTAHCIPLDFHLSITFVSNVILNSLFAMPFNITFDYGFL